MLRWFCLLRGLLAGAHEGVHDGDLGRCVGAHALLLSRMTKPALAGSVVVNLLERLMLDHCPSSLGSWKPSALAAER